MPFGIITKEMKKTVCKTCTDKTKCDCCEHRWWKQDNPW